MDQQATLTKIKELVDKAKEIAIITHGKPTVDSIGGALSLYLGLTGLGKKVHIVCPDAMTVEFSSYVGVDKITSKLGGKKNFVISLDYQEGSIEKVSYNIEENKFNLVIEPREGFESFSEEKVHYTTSGMKADLFIIVDTQHLGQLGELYSAEKELFATIPMINIDSHDGNAMFGEINFVDAQSSSTTELIAVVMSFCGVKLSEDIATNLLNAVDSITNHFQSSKVNARTFEIASVSMKAGGKKFLPVTQPVVEESLPPKVDIQLKEPLEVQQSEDFLKPKIFKSPTN